MDFSKAISELLTSPARPTTWSSVMSHTGGHRQRERVTSIPTKEIGKVPHGLVWGGCLRVRNSKSPQPHSAIPTTQHCPSVLQTQACLGELALCSLPEGSDPGESIQVLHISESKILEAFDQTITLRAEARVDMKPTL